MSQVLVAEDDIAVGEFLGKALRKGVAGVCVEQAWDGGEALEKLCSRRYDVGAIDVYMPRLNGLEQVRMARAREVETGFVILTGRPSLEVAVEAGRNQVGAFLTKPVRPGELIAAVQELLDRREGGGRGDGDGGWPGEEGHSTGDPVVAFIAEEFCIIRSQEQVARQFGITSRTVTNRVKRATGQTFEHFLHHCRVEAAKKVLRETGLTVRQISDWVGASTESHFCRLFKEFTGRTPEQYRQEKRQRKERRTEMDRKRKGLPGER